MTKYPLHRRAVHPLAIGALTAAALLGASPTAALALAPSDPMPVQTAAPSSPIPYAQIFTDITSTGVNLTDDGMLHVSAGRAVVSGKLIVPDSAKPGDILELTPSEHWNFVAFSSLELRTDDKKLIATMQATAKSLRVTFADAVAELGNASASFEFFMRGVHQEGPPLETTLDLMSSQGTRLGPGDTYTLQPTLPNATGMLLSPSIWQNELTVLVSPQYSPRRDIPLDPASVSVEVTANTKGAVCAADGPASMRWINSAGYLFGAVERSGFTTKCSGQTLTFSLDPGVKVPATATGIRFNGTFVVDRPVSDYEFAAEITANGNDSTSVRTATSGQLDGAADGVVRPARILTSQHAAGSSERLMSGDTVVFTSTTKNAEEFRMAYGVVTTNELPAGTEFVSADRGGQLKNGRVVWPAVDLEDGKSSVVSYKVKVSTTSEDSLVGRVSNAGVNTCFPGDTTGSVCTASARVHVVAPGLETEKSVSEVIDTNEDGVIGDAGDTIVFRISATNTGNTEEPSILLTDELLNISDAECLTEPLAPGDTVECAGDFRYLITQEDEEAGEVHNVATLSVPGIDPVPGEVTVPTLPTPEPVVKQPEPPTATPAALPAKLAATGADPILLSGVAVAALAGGGLALALALQRKRSRDSRAEKLDIS